MRYFHHGSTSDLIYASNAERQKAYRDRQAETRSKPRVPTAPKPRRQPSRPARLAALLAAVAELQSEYQVWLEAIPEALQDGEQAARLTETIEALENVAELLSQIEPPRGFGRD
jgi:hypothetical protein